MMKRRTVLSSLTALGVAGIVGRDCAAEGAAARKDAAVNPAVGAREPKIELVYECDVTLSDPQSFGVTAEGQRRIIPITGGTFHGPELKGRVLSGGADWNLLRTDGVHSVEAAYYLRTDDGVILRIVNKGVGGGGQREDPDSGERFFMFTTPSFEAPTGKYDWMNRTTFVATLGARRNARNAVLIRVYKLV